MIGALTRFELAGARNDRTVRFFAAAFALASIVIAVVGTSAGGTIAVQGFARTSMSLLQLILWVVPLLALLTGAVAGAECFEVEFIAALPSLSHARSHLVISRWAAWLIALGGALFVGLGGAGIVIAVFAGSADGFRYAALLVVATLLLSACLAVGLALGVYARSRGRALALAIVAWCVLVVGADLLAIGLLAILPAGTVTWPLSVLLVADPVDAARVLGLGLFNADVVAGPTGAALRAVMGGGGASLLVGGLAAWTAVPLAFATRTLRRRDL